MEGLRGSFFDGLGSKDTPFFILTNSAKGVSGKQSRYFVSQALKIRGKAMAANAALILAGKKSYSYN